MNVELLAPAGSFESLTAAINAGADAVYIGGEKFGARAYAKNLTEEQMLEAIDYVHLYGKKIYLTVNTLLKNRELEEELYEYLLPFYKQGLDAVIVQDIGVLQFIKRNFKDLHVHASTQMTITGVGSARLLEKLGATRVVTARELSLEELRKIHQATKIEMESFVHGALCYCYSGQCLFSSLIGGRSGNRGRCAQPCRLPYEVYDSKKKISTKSTAYSLSPKDMCTLEILPEIIESGVYSLKIEGRMKRPEYTAGVVEVYRKNIDSYLQNPKSYKVDKEDLKQLYELYNRDGFNKGYYKQHNGKDMMALENQKAQSKVSNEKNIRNEVLFEQLRQKHIEVERKISINGNLYMEVGVPISLTVYNEQHQVTVTGEVVQKALKQPLQAEQIEKKLKQTGNTHFSMEDCQIHLEGDVFLPIGKINELRRQALEEFQEELLMQYRRECITSYLEEKDSNAKERQATSKKVQMHSFTISTLVESDDQFDAVMKWEAIQEIFIDFRVLESSNSCHDIDMNKLKHKLKETQKNKKKLYLALPRIVRYRNLEQVKSICGVVKELGISGFLVRNLETYGLLKDLGYEHLVIVDQNIYTYNNEAIKFWDKEGIIRNTIPLELNAKELKYRKNTHSEMIIYGFSAMMVTAQCVKKSMSGCDKKNQLLRLRDRYQKEFTVQYNCRDCYNVIYNSIPYALLKEKKELAELGINFVRLDFSIESGKETEEILKLFTKAYQEDIQLEHSMEFTKGHFKRGVE